MFTRRWAFRQTTRTLVALAFLLTAIAVASAQHGYRLTRRLRFEAGRAAAVVKGRLTSRLEVHEYLLGVRSGQTTNVRLTSANPAAEFLILRPGGEVIEGANATRDWSGKLAEPGDYHINVYTTRGVARYTLEATIR